MKKYKIDKSKNIGNVIFVVEGDAQIQEVQNLDC